MKKTSLSPFFIQTITQNLLTELTSFSSQKRKRIPTYKKCTLPGCEEITAHNGGYCCANHCKQHRNINKK